MKISDKSDSFDDKPLVLFVCQNNTARSIAAEFLCKHHLPYHPLTFHSASLSPPSSTSRPKDAVLKALASRGVCTAEATSKSSNTFPYTKYLIALCCYEPGAAATATSCDESGTPLSSCPPGDGCCRRPPKNSPPHEIFLHLELPNTREYEDDMGGWVDKCWEELTSGLTLLGIL